MTQANDPYMKTVAIVTLIAQTVAMVFLMRQTRNEDPDTMYLTSTAVVISEMMKLVAAFVFLLNENNWDMKSTIATVRLYTVVRVNELAMISVPGLLYTLQNNLLFIALSNLTAAVYQVTYQMKILVTALLSVIVLGRSLDSSKWVALCMLTMGVTTIQLDQESRRGDVPPPPGQSPIVGLAAIIGACFTSGFAGVYLEKLMKSSDASVWVKNIQLALIGSVMGTVMCAFQDYSRIWGPEGRGFLQGYRPIVWVVCSLQAVGGLAVAAVLKYADNIAKCFASAASICMLVFLTAAYEIQPHMIGPDGAPIYGALGRLSRSTLMTVSFFFGTSLVIAATALYSLGWPAFIAQMAGGSQTKPAYSNVPKDAKDEDIEMAAKSSMAAKGE